ncbi:MAG: DUF3795 domain-containing protein [Anaerolineaceae bacterium]|nr:DUF3795 domain-containing protein [Anaerolineaceae bacterium]MDD4042870.1 DUF3795 domain-containing protein [Anaerolineaceae bacterium]MDD4578894.1 DUF3795 domain-containing protein [Anaerolineaceae bacterium]
MEEELIAPCGMNCSLCAAYQFKQKDLNKQVFTASTARAASPGVSTAPTWLMLAICSERVWSGFVLNVSLTLVKD